MFTFDFPMGGFAVDISIYALLVRTLRFRALNEVSSCSDSTLTDSTGLLMEKPDLVVTASMSSSDTIGVSETAEVLLLKRGETLAVEVADVDGVNLY